MPSTYHPLLPLATLVVQVLVLLQVVQYKYWYANTTLPPTLTLTMQQPALVPCFCFVAEPLYLQQAVTITMFATFVGIPPRKCPCANFATLQFLVHSQNVLLNNYIRVYYHH